MKLNIIHEHKIAIEGNAGLYTILGRLPMDLSSLKVTIHLQTPQVRKQRLKLDLYDYAQIQKNCINLSETEDISYNALESDLLRITDLLENHRDSIFEEEYAPKISKPTITLKQEKEAITFLTQKNLLTTINRTLGETGIIGEASNRLLLFIIASSYKNGAPLHALVNSSSGSGKSHLINSIANCFPTEDVISFSRISSKSLYHFRKEELVNKLVIVQDFDGIDEEGLYAFRELQSFGSLTSSITYKDRFGNLTSKTQTTKAHFSSLGATTKNIYTDNESRSVLLKIDESPEQTKAIIQFQNKLRLGKIDKKLINDSQLELSLVIRQLKPYTIKNPYAEKIQLPLRAKMLRRLNQQFQDFICQITFIHQYQRKTDKDGNLLTTKEDVENAINIFFESIHLKIDELSPNLRLFYERLKKYLVDRDSKNESSKRFTQREVRQAFNLSSSHCHRQIKSLLELEYLTIVKGNAARGYHYRLDYWDSYELEKEKLKKELLSQLKKA